MLLGRMNEKKFLEHYYEQEGNRIVVVYGQKNVGKTTLIRDFASDKPHAYYLARPCSAREQLWQWGRELAADKKELGEYPGYQEIFKSLIQEELVGQKQLLLLDEFHHIVKSDSGFMKELIQFVEGRRLSRPVMVVLCTSASGWVENSMVRKMGESAFYLNGLLKVKEMRFTDICGLFPKFTPRESLEIYAILGGIPGLWKSFDESLSVEENITQRILAKESRLYEEMNVCLSEELREPAVYNTILAALAAGRNKLNEIYRHTGFSRAKISVYLKNLMELDMVEKVFSMDTEGRANTRKGIYRITNPFVRFYFRFLFPRQSLLQKEEATDFYEQNIKEELPGFMEAAFKKVCRERVEALSKEGSIPYTEMGEWIGKGGILDMVAQDKQENTLIVHCKYAEEMKYKELEELLRTAKKARLKPQAIWLFAGAGFEEKLVRKAEKMPELTLQSYF